ncbi:MAG: hypothetical protein V4760_07465 [Bdellovibrionota bacterium]
MRNPIVIRSLVALSASLTLLVSAEGYAQAKPSGKPTTIAELAAGAPKAMDVLGQSSFVPFEVVSLAEARVAYMDYEWFREMGVEIPPEGLRSPELNKQMIDAFGWMTPGVDDKDHSFDKTKKRTMWAYYYGGDGLGGNVGSGRSASMSHFDMKGLATPLIKSKDTYHSNGAAVTIEAIDEAIWSKVLESETRYGANRVVAVIFTGTYVKTPGAEDRYAPRALIVREMGLRPASFMLNTSRDQKADEARVAETMKSLLQSLPYPTGYDPANQSPSEAARMGMLELTRREAIVQAEMYAKRLYFGSNSPSNLEITGRRLDLGDHTAQKGYTKIIRISDESPFGETDEFKRIQELIRTSFAKTLPSQLSRALPTKEELAAEFDRTWDVRQKVEMIKLAGVPNELAERLVRTSQSQALGAAIIEVASAGNTERVFFDPSVSPNTSKYDLGRVLTILVHANASERLNAVSRIIQDSGLRSRLVVAYENYLGVLDAAASREGISRSSLRKYSRHAVEIRNRTRETLFRGDKRWKHLWAVTDQALLGKNGMITQTYVEEEIAKNRQNFKDAKRFELVLENRENAAEGWSLRKVFDAKTGEYAAKLMINVANGKGYFNGRSLSVVQLERAVLEKNDGEKRVVAASRNGKYVEFTITGTQTVDPSKLAVVTSEEYKAKQVAVARSTMTERSDVRVVRPVRMCKDIFMKAI